MIGLRTVVTLETLPVPQRILSLQWKMWVVARRAGQVLRRRKTPGLNQTNGLKAGEVRIVGSNFVNFDLFRTTVTLSAAVDSFCRRCSFPEVVVNFAIAGNVGGARPVATLTVHSGFDVFKPQPAIIKGQVTGMAGKATSGFRVIVQNSEWPEVRFKMLSG